MFQSQLIRSGALTLLFALSLALPEEVVVKHPNGEVHVRYSTDEKGRLDGLYEEFTDTGLPVVRAEYARDLLNGSYRTYWPDGKLRTDGNYANGFQDGAWIEYAQDGVKTLAANYRKDQLHGRYESYHANGNRFVTANYKLGVLNGEYAERQSDGDWVLTGKYADGSLDGLLEVHVAGKRLVQQKWSAGELVELDGVQPFPKSSGELLAELGAILEEPADAEYDLAADSKAPGRAAALRRLQAYRHLCGLQWKGMELVPEWNELCDAASEVCEANGELDHTPPQPAGFDAQRFQQGYRGASNSNLSMGKDMAGSVDSYMDDSDATNIDRVGHRRWCLNPPMRKTGFGLSGRFSAMWSMDQSGSMPKGLDAIVYPPPGWTPVDMFGARHAWNFGVLRGKAPRLEDLRVSVRRLDERWIPSANSLEFDHRGIAEGGIGTGTFVLFRPVGIVVEPGAAYLVELSFDGGASIAHRYVSGFCEANGSGVREARED
jgi:antitoxin component YwqK of YwqJK toxin-antitoxin module